MRKLSDKPDCTITSGLPIITGQFFESHSLKLHPRGVFLFSWIFFLSRRSSLSYSDLRRSMLEGQSPTCWILFILLSLSAHQIKDDRAPSSAKLIFEEIFPVLTFHSNDVRPNKPYIEPLTLVTP